ncbi:hypothetical protein MTR67_049921 [Solanum verrucosum]|uniref:Uncharacterized protein n=1 Tax=Solanum verrucosum TaxID=315347 RepID=A0AAF0ZYS3_SOLVR|nr:hypothetical protein MTR67_049921 [Solanum verrucosum]
MWDELIVSSPILVVVSALVCDGFPLRVMVVGVYLLASFRITPALLVSALHLLISVLTSERFYVSRRRFDGGDYGEEMQDPKDYVKKVCFDSFRITPAYFGHNKWYQSHGSMMELGYRWVFILAGVVLVATFLIVMKIFVGEIVSERFSVSRGRFDGGDYGEEMQDPKDYVKKVAFAEWDLLLTPYARRPLAEVCTRLTFASIEEATALLKWKTTFKNRDNFLLASWKPSSNACRDW